MLCYKKQLPIGVVGDVVRHGSNKCSSPHYSCKDCGARRVLNPKQKQPPRPKEQVRKAYRERMSLRDIERVFGICRQTVMHWLQAHLQNLPTRRWVCDSSAVQRQYSPRSSEAMLGSCFYCVPHRSTTHQFEPD